mgnify:CR=1 FL=1|tara:strand:+ start:569 stop:1033 length:465 start_codon:yes stop_codon:yes gene_type:complete
MNKDIKAKEAFAQKIAQMEDSGLTPDQKNLVKHIEQAIETNKSKSSKEIDYHRYWKDLYEKEHKLRLEAEGETHLVKAVGMNSPEMKEAKAKLKELEVGLANALEVNESHQKLNGKLQMRLTELEQEIIELHADNKKLANQIEDRINQMRKAGM